MVTSFDIAQEIFSIDMLTALQSSLKPSSQACSAIIPTIGGLQMTSSKHDHVNYDQFAPNFVIAYKTIQRVSVPNLNLFGPMKT